MFTYSFINKYHKLLSSKRSFFKVARAGSNSTSETKVHRHGVCPPPHPPPTPTPPPLLPPSQRIAREAITSKNDTRLGNSADTCGNANAAWRGRESAVVWNCNQTVIGKVENKHPPLPSGSQDPRIQNKAREVQGEITPVQMSEWHPLPPRLPGDRFVQSWRRIQPAGEDKRKTCITLDGSLPFGFKRESGTGG